MYIEPNSTIILLTDVPIEPDQSNTLYFDNVAEQTAYFQSKTLRSFAENTYQRVNRGFTRLQVSADQVYSANYMMFRNISYGGKWFYAFVNSVEYINNITTQINFTIDPIQTWFFEYHEDACFVERMHAYSDDIGEHLEPEPVQLSEYIYGETYPIVDGETIVHPFIGPSFAQSSIIVNYIDPSSGDPTGSIYGGVFSAGELYGWGMNELEGNDGLKQWIANHMTTTTDAILTIYMCPLALHNTTGGDKIDEFLTISSETDSFYPASNELTFDGYVPKNNKLYTFPYNFFQARDNCGNSLTLRYEFFSDLTPTFSVSGNCVNPVELVLYPTNYRGLSTDTSQRLVIKGFPQCSWSGDAYKAWLAQNTVPYLMRGTSAVLPMIASAGAGVGLYSAGAISAASATGNVGTQGFNMLNSVLGTVTDFMANTYSASLQADITKGSISSGNVDFANLKMHFEGNRLCVTAECARRIDDFFTAFGYAVGRVMIPLRKVRSRFTYVKTADANIHGDLPADDAQYIANCYNRGIRFWADHSTSMGTYASDNDVLI